MKKPIRADLKLDCTYLNQAQVKVLIDQTIKDGFNVIGISRDCGVSEVFPPPFEFPSFPDTLILSRINVKIASEKDLGLLNKLVNKSYKYDLLSLQFDSAEVLESFLSKNQSFGDELIFLNVSEIILSQKVFQLLRKKEFFIEFGYKDVIYCNNQKLALVNFIKIFDSQHQNVVLSSNCSTVLERRAQWELDGFIKGMLD